MIDVPVDVETSPDGTLVIQPHGVVGVEHAVSLRRAFVRAVRHVRPLRLVVDLRNVVDLDPINLGTVAAACQMGDDYQVAVFLDYCTPALAGRLTSAGVPGHRLRHIRGAGNQSCP